MKAIISVFIVFLLSTASVAANENAPVMKVIRTWITDFNTGDTQSAIKLCAERGAIIDGIAPYVWQGEAACSTWLRAYDAAVKQQEETAVTYTAGKVRHFEIVKDDAYVVLPVTATYKHKGRPTTEGALVTMALHKGPSGWRITGWTWAER